MTTLAFDMTKMRLLLHGKFVVSNRRTNAFLLASKIVSEQDPAGLYKGLAPAILRYLFYTPVRIVGYERLRNLLCSDGGGGSLSFPSNALSSSHSPTARMLLQLQDPRPRPLRMLSASLATLSIQNEFEIAIAVVFSG